jgi:hypothetical protein
LTTMTSLAVDWATVDLASQRWAVPLPEHGSAEWLEMRRPYANASTAAVHVREHEHESIAEWAARKISGAEVDETPKMKMGKMLEPALLAWYGLELGIPLLTPDRAWGIGRLLANPDGYALRLGAPIGVEIKSTPGRRSRKSRYWQCVAGLAATGWREWHLVELEHEYGTLDVTMIIWCDQVERDVRRLLAAVDSDWAWVDMRMLPEDAEVTTEVARLLHPKVREAKRVLPESAEELLRQRKEAKARLKAAEDEFSLLDGALRDLIGDAELAVLPNGRKVGTYKMVNGSSLAKAKLEEAHPGLLADYTVPNPYRTLRLAKEWAA